MTVVPCFSMQTESTLSRQASESGGAESNTSALTQGDTSASEDQEASDQPLPEQVLHCNSGLTQDKQGTTLPAYDHHLQIRLSLWFYMFLPMIDGVTS